MANFLSQVAKITDHLYLSSFVGATDFNLMKFNISCIITVCKEVPKVEFKNIESVKLDVVDRPTESLAKYFDFVCDKINEVAGKKGICLVHCVAGVSRSASMVLAYLMKYHRMNLKDAHSFTKSKRPFIRPNLGFWKQLVEYELSLFGTNSVKIVPSNIGFIPDIYENEVKSMQWAKSNAPIAGTLAATNAANNYSNNSRNKPFNEPIIGNSIAITKLGPNSSTAASNAALANQIEATNQSKSNKTHYTTTYRASYNYQKP